ncbi:3-oxoacyl-[acyl-carrier protein] reductase [Patulibacter medicamentivorans]|uniref:3-oxoacyl-[acyl-carrier protein] reductase n=1 Tax=Patulibacter medicamentivorans TaxID=1097667 RepID=H0E4X9_9ACTN|nr:3-oxoacyl-ACP reductase [Patulibacter medicamentivorans]EHN11274.1 3-oxoacyl-[acyl-carrier protein] reductase [Patulibacter medicamentivorans]
MSDRYQQFVNSFLGKQIAPRVGLPQPPFLKRHRPGAPVVDGPVLLGQADGGRLGPAVSRVLAVIGAETWTAEGPLRDGAAEAGLSPKIWSGATGGDQRFQALVFDATGISSAAELAQLHAFFQPVARRVRPSGRVVVLGTTPELVPGTGAAKASARVAQRALEGFTRSLGKEIGKGSTVQLVYVAPDADDQIESTLRFLLSPKSAFVSGQVVRISQSGRKPDLNWTEPLKGKVALVTGASRGIGEAIAETLARDGAHVVGLDIEPLADDLKKVTDRIGGSAITFDVTAQDAPAELAAKLKADHGGVDIVVHNAGITRDKLLANMKPEVWAQVIAVNLEAPERITRELLKQKAINPEGRIIGVASIAGVAGNRGQTNYGTSKAGVIGFVDAFAAEVAKQQLTINAVAPGFIETKMTAAIPLTIREAGRRMSSLGQGGLPIDVAETIAWYASPGSAGVNGNTVRVCGQSLIGA